MAPPDESGYLAACEGGAARETAPFYGTPGRDNCWVSMTPEAEAFFSLDDAARKRVHLFLCRQALTTWQAFTAETGPMVYVDSVVGLRHRVEQALPERAFESAQAGRSPAGLADAFLEPITALQDDDWELPERPRFAYYSIYNLWLKYAMQEQIDDWIIVNQALASQKPEDWMGLLRDALSSTPPNAEA